MDPANLICNGILFVIFLIFAMFAVKASPGGFLGAVIWFVIIVVVVAFVVYVTFSVLGFALFGLMMAQKQKSEPEDRSYMWEPMDFTIPYPCQTWESFYEDLLKRMKENIKSDYDKEIVIDNAEK